MNHQFKDLKLRAHTYIEIVVFHACMLPHLKLKWHYPNSLGEGFLWSLWWYSWNYCVIKMATSQETNFQLQLLVHVSFTKVIWRFILLQNLAWVVPCNQNFFLHFSYNYFHEVKKLQLQVINVVKDWIRKQHFRKMS